MNNNKQSSIELFAIVLYEKGFLKGNGDAINDLLEEHKAMHNEEMKEMYLKGIKNYDPKFGGNNE